MLVSMFLLVTMQSISAVETTSGFTAPDDDEITPEPSDVVYATVEGWVRYGVSEYGHAVGEPVRNLRVDLNTIRGLWHDNTNTDDEGYYKFENVPIRRTLLPKWYTVECEWIPIAGEPLWYWRGCSGMFRITGEGTYKADIDMHPFYQTSYTSEENMQNLQSIQQQVESIFSGSQSL